MKRGAVNKELTLDGLKDQLGKTKGGFDEIHSNLNEIYTGLDEICTELVETPARNDYSNGEESEDDEDEESE